MNRNLSFPKMDIDYSSSFAAAVCIGPVPKPLFPMAPDYMQKLQRRLSLFDRISEAFQKNQSGLEYTRNTEQLFLLCSFPLKSREDFAERFLRSLVLQIEKETGAVLLTGIGIPAANQLHLEESLSTSRNAFELYFFEEDRFFEYQKWHRRYSLSFEEYQEKTEKAFQSVLMKSPSALEDIDRCLELIGRIHYGNKGAATMRTMNYTGEMAFRLQRYHLVEEDFYRHQDALQEKVLSALTFREVKEIIHDYYQTLLPEIYSKTHTGRSSMVEQMKTYIKENYMTPLTLSSIAALACVSPGYFSHAFKEETGISFKGYLTEIRLDAAMELLLGSDLRLYEISEKTGYNNVRNLEEAFRKKYGCFPGEYKKQYLNR